MVKRAILSVSDKTGIVELARRLAAQGVTLLSTGGTMKAIEEAGIPVTGVSDVTGFPECLDGRVKTLHPAIHAGLLAVRDNPEHMKQLEQLGVEPIDMVVINLYPFRATIEKPGVTFDEAIENIDIGGPTMLRAAAKNAQDVVVVIDPADYELVLNELEATGDVSLKTKRYLQYKVFEHTAQYDCMIQQYLRGQLEDAPAFPQNLTVTFEKVQEMRYGENPHQKAAFYRDLGDVAGTLPAAKQLHGKELSYNNINDTNGALELLREFDTTAVIAVKHGNPCGVGVADAVSEAYRLAYEADPVSVFGGIVVTNGTVDAATGMISGGERNDTKNMGYDFRAVLGSNISENVDFTLSWNGTYNEATNSLNADKSKNRYFNHTAQGNLKVVFPLGFTFTASAAYSQYIGFTNDYSEDYLLCNVWLGKKVFKNKRGEVMVGVNDLFNQNRAFSRSTGSGYTQNSTNSVIGRYYMVQFNYNLRRFGKKGSRNIKDYDGVESSSGSRRMGPGGPGGPPPGMFHGPR